MGWLQPLIKHTKRFGSLALLSMGVLLASNSTQAQTVSVSNDKISLAVTDGIDGLYFNVATTGGNTTNPSNTLMYGLKSTDIYRLQGSRLYIRVDGGFDNLNYDGWDYIFGESLFYGGTAGGGTGGTGGTTTSSFGGWITPPKRIGATQIYAKWLSGAFFYGTTTGGGGGGAGGGGGGTGGTGILAFDQSIEVTMVATIVGETVRFQFDVFNGDTLAHTIAAGFVQDISTPNTAGTVLTSGQGDGPFYLPNSPYLRKEAILVGPQVPPYWEVHTALSAGTSPPDLTPYHSVRGVLRPVNSGTNEPTVPDRVSFGEINSLNGFSGDCFDPKKNLTGQNVFSIFTCVWNNVVSKTRLLEQEDCGVAIFWDGKALAPKDSYSVVTYLGTATVDTDATPPMALSVSVRTHSA